MKNSFLTKIIDDQIQKKNNFESELIENTDDNKLYITISYVRKGNGSLLHERHSFTRSLLHEGTLFARRLHFCTLSHMCTASLLHGEIFWRWHFFTTALLLNDTFAQLHIFTVTFWHDDFFARSITFACRQI